MIQYLTSRFRDKTKIVLSILILASASLFLLVAYFILAYYQYTINKTVDKKEDNRTIIVSGIIEKITEKDLEELANMNHVIEIYEEYANWNLKEKENVFIPYNSRNNTSPLSIGKQIEKSNEALINRTAAKEYHLSVGDTLHLNKKYELRIVGIIEDTSLPSIYLENKTLRQIALEENASLSKINIILDEYKYIEPVIKELNQKGYEGYKNETLDHEVNKLEEIISSISYGIYFILFFSILLIFAIFRYLLKGEYKNNALLKLLGYKNRKIVCMNAIYLLLLIFFTLLSECIIYFFIKGIGDAYYLFTISYIEFFKKIKYIFLIYVTILFLLSIENFLKLRRIDMLNTIEES